MLMSAPGFAVTWGADAGDSEAAAAAAFAATSSASASSRSNTPLARCKFALRLATSTGTCRHADVSAAARASVSANLACDRISASMASPSDPTSAPAALASASASSSATYPLPCGIFTALAYASRIFCRASLRRTLLPSKMRVRRSMRTRRASRSSVRARLVCTDLTSELSCHSVRTTNGTLSSRSVSAAFTMPSPSLSAADSSPGEDTLTTMTSRFSRRPSFFFSSTPSPLRYRSSELTLSLPYVPNEYGASGHSVSKNSRRSPSVSVGSGKRICGLRSPARERSFAGSPMTGWRMPAAAVSADAVISTALRVSAVAGCVQPCHAGNPATSASPEA
mmetsp:Transcript_390/g.1415  ORF Transcript_390/g.1415 Transcript_390/m.1415 type:complete len:337 (+) Transcript_390:134-1144(+)